MTNIKYHGWNVPSTIYTQAWKPTRSGDIRIASLEDTIQMQLDLGIITIKNLNPGPIVKLVQTINFFYNENFSPSVRKIR